MALKKKDVMERFIIEIKRRYSLRGYSDEEIRSWIVIQFKSMEDQLSRDGGIKVVDAIEKVRKKRSKKK